MTKHMNRRGFLRRMSGSIGLGLMPMTLTAPALGATPERFLITVNADGGWDPTALADPKGDAMRSDGRGPVNEYPASAIGSAGNLRYAAYPYGITPPEDSPGHLATFFNKHYRRLLVINGIDTQTNGHDSGRRFVWSGKLEEGYPSITALAAAPYAEQPMAFISNGGYDFTASLVASVRTASPKTFASLAYPNSLYPEHAEKRDEHKYFNDSTYTLIQQARRARLERQQDAASLPRHQQLLAQLHTARHGDVNLDTLLSVLPDSLSGGLRGQAEVAVAAFASNLAVGANLNLGGFDTHGNHDFEQTQALTELLDGIDHLWNLIEASNLQDKVTVIIGSDFGRTPFYNSGNGKDHWNVTSLLAMGAGITGNRVIGATDANYEALKLNPATLRPDSSGIIVTPRHVHRALRDFLGVSDDLDALFPVHEQRLELFG